MKIEALEKGIEIAGDIESTTLQLEWVKKHELEISISGSQLTMLLTKLSPAVLAVTKENTINDLELTIKTLKAELEAL